MTKRYTRLNWQDEPSVATPISATNLNKMDKGINDIDNAIEEIYNKRVNNVVTTNPDTFLAGPVGKTLQDQITTLNNKLVGKILGELTVRFVPYNALPSDDTPGGWIAAYGHKAVIISDILNYNNYYGVMITIIGSADTSYIGQIIITTAGAIRARVRVNNTQWTNWA